MSTSETSTDAVSTPLANVTSETGTAGEDGSEAEETAEDSGDGVARARQAANIQEILSEISNDVQADPLPDSGTSHVKKRVLKDKRLTLRRQRQKEASLEGRESTAPEPEDPMLATF